MDKKAGAILVSSLAALVVLAQPQAAVAQSKAATAMDGSWHFKVAPYVWGSGMNGKVGVTDVVELPVDMSFGDVLSNLDFGLFGRFEGRKDRLGFGTDLAYMNLGAEVEGAGQAQLGLGADVRSFTFEGVFTYRVVNDTEKGTFVDLLAGARYMSNRAGLALTQGGDEIAGTDRTLDWVDGVVGARFSLPLSDKFALHGRGDIAGLGSDFTWNLQGGIDMALGESWTLGAGYRYLDVDYDKGEGIERRVWQIVYQGPYLFASYSW